MATLRLTMAFDPPEDNVMVSGLGREEVREVYAVLNKLYPQWFPEKEFTWEEIEAPPREGVFMWPTTSNNRWITQRFGENENFYRERFGVIGGHNGLDLGIWDGTHIFAALQGIVEKVDFDKDGYGNYVEISHPNSFGSIYAHLKKASVKEGDAIARLELVGLSGNTGCSTGPHLHFGIKKDGKWIDPLPLLN